MTNYGTGNKGSSGDTEEIQLDLEQTAQDELHGRFDVVFCHTTLEHVHHMQRAVATLCQMSRDIVILVVPFMQVEHWAEGSFGDYWRFCANGVNRLFTDNDFSVVYLSSNHNPVYPIYYFAVASRTANQWISRMPIPGRGESCVIQTGPCAYRSTGTRLMQ